MTQTEYTQMQATDFTPNVHISVYNNSNPGPTGWAAAWLDESGRLQEVSNVVADCSNMRASLIAATAALRAFPSRTQVNVICSIQYLTSYNLDLPGWKQRGWRLSNGKPVKNIDEWVELDKIACRRSVTFTTKDTDPRSLASYAREVAITKSRSKM